MQYYLELSPPVPDLVFDSSEFARAGAYLDSVADQLKIKSVFEFFSYGAARPVPAGLRRNGRAVVRPAGGDRVARRRHRPRVHNPDAVERPERLVQDLTECQNVLRRAMAARSKWHFAMDI